MRTRIDYIHTTPIGSHSMQESPRSIECKTNRTELQFDLFLLMELLNITPILLILDNLGNQEFIEINHITMM